MNTQETKSSYYGVIYKGFIGKLCLTSNGLIFYPEDAIDFDGVSEKVKVGWGTVINVQYDPRYHDLEVHRKIKNSHNPPSVYLFRMKDAHDLGNIVQDYNTRGEQLASPPPKAWSPNEYLIDPLPPSKGKAGTLLMKDDEKELLTSFTKSGSKDPLRRRKSRDVDGYHNDEVVTRHLNNAMTTTTKMKVETTTSSEAFTSTDLTNSSNGDFDELREFVVEEIETLDMDLPEDIFTMMFLASWKSLVFWVGFFFLFLQISVLHLAMYDMLHDKKGQKDHNDFNVPATTTLQIIAAQFIALLLSVLTQEDLTNALLFLQLKVASINGGFEIVDKDTEDVIQFCGTRRQFWLANTLRFMEGLYTLFACAVFVLQSPTVIDILKDFAAILFVSELDDLGFRLAKEGWLGRHIKSSTEPMVDKKFSVRAKKETRARSMKGRISQVGVEYLNRGLLLLICVALYAWHIETFTSQNKGVYIYADSCGVLDVQFGEDVYFLSSKVKFQSNDSLVLKNDNLTFDDKWGVPRVLDPSFNLSDPPDLHYAYFSGKYYAHPASDYCCDDDEFKGLYSGTEFDSIRPVYTEGNPERLYDTDVGIFYYCKKEAAWVWTIRAFVDAGAVPTKTWERCPLGWLMKSPPTEAVRLEDAPTDGWRVYTGALDAASAISFTCTACKDDTECDLDNGECSGWQELQDGDEGNWRKNEHLSLWNNKVCKCNSGYDGDFCNFAEPCKVLLASSNKNTPERTFFYDYRYKKALRPYDRPIYFSNWADRGGQNYTEILAYAGRRWMMHSFKQEVYLNWEQERERRWKKKYNLNYFWDDDGDDDYKCNKKDPHYHGKCFDDPQVHEEYLYDLYDQYNHYHGYWYAATTLINASLSFYSEPTDSFVPTSKIKWYKMDKTRARGDFGSFGREIETDYSIRCLFVDCEARHVCGGYGNCEKLLEWNGMKVTDPWNSSRVFEGGSCNCTNGYTGHFCQIPPAEATSKPNKELWMCFDAEGCLERATCHKNTLIM